MARAGTVASSRSLGAQALSQRFLPPLHFEMLNNDAIDLIAGAATSGRVHGLPWMVDNVTTLI